MATNEEKEAREALRALIEDNDNVNAAALAAIAAKAAYVVAREELERAGVTPAPWKNAAERGHTPSTATEARAERL